MTDVTIALDAMGGDSAPTATVAGAVLAAATGVSVRLCGPTEVLRAELGGEVQGIEIVEAPDVIDAHDEPAAAVRAKERSSLVVACREVREGRAQGVVSAGPTGAMMAAALIQLGRIKGIARPGIAVPLPAAGTPCLLIDCGANPEAKPDHLAKYGIMGAEFASDVLGVDRPRVGLLSIGEEASKGTAVTLEAHALLAASELNFGGNCEGRDVLTGEFQVVVADGFAGNVLLKGLEGAGVALFTQLRAAADSSLRAKIGGLLLRPAVRAIRTKTDPENYGGAYLLGVRGVVSIAHGNSNSTAIRNAITYTAKGVSAGVVERLSARVAATASPPESTSELQSAAGTHTVPRVAATEIGEE